jgi:predicted exporter
VLVAATAVVVLARSEFSDDIRLLNTSSPRLIDNEIRVNQLLGGMDTQRFWTVAGDSEQQVLERTEQMLATLPPTAQVMAASQLVPSLRQQQQDHQLAMAKLYGPGGALELLCAALHSDCQVWQDQDYRFRTGLDLQAIPPAVAEAFPVLSMVDGHHGIILPFLGRDFGAAELPRIAPTAGVHFVDKVSELSGTLAAFRIEITGLLWLFLLAFAVLCLWFYRRHAVVVVTPVLVSLAVALASSAGNGITLFHVLALLLVAGIAIDAGIFYLELGLNGDTWLASTLATLTSVLAFGLLSLSQFPVLHQFGTVVSAGLLCAWLVTPVIYLAGQPTTSTAMKARKQ